MKNETPPNSPICAWSHVEIDGGIVKASSDDTIVGRKRFFVDLIDEKGTVCGMWDGASYADALVSAAELAEGRLPVINRVTGGPH